MRDDVGVMENTYVIKWSSLDKTRFGQGKKMLSAEEAIQLADELNEEFPNFTHEPLNLCPTAEVVPMLETVTEPAVTAEIINFPIQEAVAV